MALDISQKVRAKLAGKKPPVTEEEILQCFANRTAKYVDDSRERHKSDPKTQWFIAETDFGRLLKIAFIQRGLVITIRTAYDPDATEIAIYKKRSQT